MSGPIFDPDVVVSGALFSLDGRSTLPGSENDMSMAGAGRHASSTLRLFCRVQCAHFEGCLEGLQPWLGRTCCFWKSAACGDRFAERFPCRFYCCRTFSCWNWSACFACQATLRLTGVFKALERNLSLASRHVDASSHVTPILPCCPCLHFLFLVCLCLLCRLVLLVVMYFRSLFRVFAAGFALVVGSGALCESCIHVVSVCVHDSGTNLIDHNSWKHGHEAAGETQVLSLSSWFKDRCSFVDTVVGGAALNSI